MASVTSVPRTVTRVSDGSIAMSYSKPSMRLVTVAGSSVSTPLSSANQLSARYAAPVSW
ncbi:hypothetical protein QFZ62_000015 [Clavibacter sp. B3I6]|nr:hypothetical protein [Clavibacter sp. B3I6]